MKKCDICNVEMIDNCVIKGQHPFKFEMESSTNIHIEVPTNEEGNILGIKYSKTKPYNLKARICPKCGKIEFYANININEK